MRSNTILLILSVLFAFTLSACTHHRQHKHEQSEKCSSCDLKNQGADMQCKAGEKHAACEMCKDGNCPDCKSGKCEKCKAAGCKGCTQGKCDSCGDTKSEKCKHGKSKDCSKC